MPSPSNIRRLTTILAADVAGYSRMMAEDEEATLRTLQVYRDVFETFARKHDGRIFNTAGDAILAEFGSAVEAVRCAVSIQEELATRNSDMSKDRQIWFRIGINVGDVIVENGDLLGDGVNVAARLEGLAEKGGICISGSTFEQVKNKLSVAFADIGPQSVKNIPEPIQTFRLVQGNVSVRSEEPPDQAGDLAPKPQAQLASKAIVLAGLAAVALSGGVVAWFVMSRSPFPDAFDGRWNVEVHSRSGCLNNETTSYSVIVRNGVIDEPGHRLPKKGTVSSDGAFRIEVSRPDGRPMNVQTGKISGNTGEGRFAGAKPGCEGKVTIRRAE